MSTDHTMLKRLRIRDAQFLENVKRLKDIEIHRLHGHTITPLLLILNTTSFSCILNISAKQGRIEPEWQIKLALYAYFVCQDSCFFCRRDSKKASRSERAILKILRFSVPITEAVILARLSGYDGVAVLFPFGGGNGRYDLVAEFNGKFYRIQCKTGRLQQEGTVVEFCTASSTYYYYGGKGREWRSYRGQVEYFGVYCPDNRKIYFVSVEDVPDGSKARLRLKETANNQQKGVLWAKNYEI